MSDVNWVEAGGASFGLLGTWLLAENNAWSRWGFVVYLLSNVAWLWFAALHRHWFLLLQYAGFTILSLRGMWRWFGPQGSASAK
jgi:hypothetical protein